ncbi:hypothetical protein BJY01DRAFT_243643 [Aspergillus pseudoustus]|uniref:Fe2OG dioxygenase domain-containing protein n=1 Tax=Aspergillus pseudoustus TaxID=1810923 RepID=A0ABR4KQF8_9EURO
MVHIRDLNAHEAPPEAIRLRYKHYHKASAADIDSDSAIVDLQALNADDLPPDIALLRRIPLDDLKPAFAKFTSDVLARGADEAGALGGRGIPVYTHRAVTGLLMVPSLFPAAVQTELLSRLLHRDLPNSDHKTNLHLHYDVTYPVKTDGEVEYRNTTPKVPAAGSRTMSFFEDDQTRVFPPKDPTVHKPFTMQTILTKKLRWVTLGGQYDWTAKVYPAEQPPNFPADVASLLRAAFPETQPEAAILNLYSPGNTLSPHRDVSEECDAGLISVSFGCDGLFLVSHDDGAGCEVVRLRSGDAVYMDGTSRFAWHAVPKVLADTCPAWLADWPCVAHGDGDGDGEEESAAERYEAWKGWMAGKRINLNVRQMVADHHHA